MLTALESPWLQPGEKLVCFGDSITAESNGYVPMLQKKLAPLDIRVINAGLPGDKTPAALTRLAEVGEHHPDAVSIYFGANDAAIGHGRHADEPEVAPETFRDNLCWMVHLLRMKHQVKKFTIIAPYPAFEGESFHFYGNILGPYCQMARQAADRIRALLAPLDTAFACYSLCNAARRTPEELLLTRDGVHPTGEGHQLIVDTLLKCWQIKQ